MKQSQVDYINFRYLLKGNYRKGVHALRSILADGGQAKAFAENPAAVAVVLSYDKNNPDKNAEELYDLLINSSVADIASATYVCNTYGVSSFEELAADAETMAEVANNASAMNGIAASAAAMAAMVACETAMTAIAESETAMTAVTSTDLAIEAIAGSETALLAISASDVAVEHIKDIELITDAIADNGDCVEHIAESPTRFALLADSEEVMSSVADNQVAMAFVASSESSMESAVASSTAVSAMVASETAANAITSSDIAMAAFDGSSSATKAAGNSDIFSAKVLAAEIGLDPAGYSDCNAVISNATHMASIAASSTAMARAAKLAAALNAICKDSAARTSWMNSEYAHTNYETVYDTLHNASTSLFAKYEDYYSEAFNEFLSSNGPSCTDSTGGFTLTNVGSASANANHKNAVPFAGITLLNTYGNYQDSEYRVHYGSSQTQEDLLSKSSTTQTDAKKVLVGGLSVYRAVYNGAAYSAANCTYATYTAV